MHFYLEKDVPFLECSFLSSVKQFYHVCLTAKVLQKPCFSNQFYSFCMFFPENWMQNNKGNIFMFEHSSPSLVKDRILHQKTNLENNITLPSTAVNRT